MTEQCLRDRQYRLQIPRRPCLAELLLPQSFGKQVKGVLRPQLRRGPDRQAFVGQLDDALRFLVRFACQEMQRRAAEANAVPVLELRLFDQRTVHIRAVVTAQIANVETVTFASNLAMRPRNPLLVDLDLVRRIPPDGHVTLVQLVEGEDRTLESAAQRDEPRRLLAPTDRGRAHRLQFPAGTRRFNSSNQSRTIRSSVADDSRSLLTMMKRCRRVRRSSWRRVFPPRRTAPRKEDGGGLVETSREKWFGLSRLQLERSNIEPGGGPKLRVQ